MCRDRAPGSASGACAAWQTGRVYLGTLGSLRRPAVALSLLILHCRFRTELV